jgi:hypothetical protein
LGPDAIAFVDIDGDGLVEVGAQAGRQGGIRCALD